MRLSQNQVFALVIAVVMVGSILGIGLGADDTGTGPVIPPGVVPQQPTTITYAASGVNAKVIQLFPTAVLAALTDADDVAPIVAAIRQVPGILAVENAQFLSSSEGGANFRAELRFSSPEKMQGAFLALNDSSSFSAVQLFPQALVSVPQAIIFTNADLGVDQNYSFPGAQLQSFVDSGALPGDEITISITAEFRGQDISNATAVIQQNRATTEQIYFTSGTYALASLGNAYSLLSVAPRSRKADLNALAAKITSTLDSNAVTGLQPLGEETRLYFASPDALSSRDINAFLADYNGIASFRLALDSNYVSVVPASGSDSNYPAFIRGIEDGLGYLGFVVESVKEPEHALRASVKAMSPREDFLSAIAALSKEAALDINVMQGAIIDSNIVSVPDQNISFPVQPGSFTALVRPNHSAGDKVNLSIMMAASQRNGASSIQAEES
ncbi:MAG: hypothetical protein HY544_04705 [Candidatus Diapherotrites archaeon]|uniref:DUF3352 domain-containing protein n=1 Tax=Candidatus Iainarchaeum sp. TaxID=3101447 RepID=A0A8T3YP55_9ARCH|nr:hypothetical protein [Candidatus Diapherotrites archaeon]